MNVEDKKNNSPISNKMRDNKDISLRPESLNEFIGQTTLCDNLKIFMQATKKRKEALDAIDLALSSLNNFLSGIERVYC